MKIAGYRKSLWVVIAGLLAGCYEAPLDQEQYFKQVYLVGAATVADGLFSQEVAYRDEPQETYVSVAVGGSLSADQDVAVTVDIHPSTIQWYNSKYLIDNAVHCRLMDDAAYSIDSYTAVIPQGEVYARLPIRINTQMLHCDSLYVIPLKITEADLPVNEADSALLFTVKLVNDYSGDYQMSGKKLAVGAEKPSSLTAGRTLIAVDEHTVRYYHETTTEEVKNAADWGINFKVNPTDNTVTVTGYDQFVVNDGGGTWDPETKTFTVWYTYNSGKTEYRNDLTFMQ